MNIHNCQKIYTEIIYPYGLSDIRSCYIRRSIVDMARQTTVSIRNRTMVNNIRIRKNYIPTITDIVCECEGIYEEY